MKNGGNRRLFYVCFIKTLKRGIFVLTRRCSCSTIWARVFAPQNKMGVVYSKKSPQGGQVLFVQGIGAGFPFSEKKGQEEEAEN